VRGFFLARRLVSRWGEVWATWLKRAKSGKRWLKKGKSGVKWGIKRAQKSAANLGKGALKMFLGTHEPRLDDKGRLILPAKFREELAAGLVITKGQERCLYVFPSQEFSVITETLKQAPVTAKSARDYSRVMFAGAHDEIPDRQGRVTIPQSLRTYAGLEKECVVIGANTRVEIWDATSWNEYLADREKSFADVSEEVFPGLF
jgi:MraZ protein